MILTPADSDCHPPTSPTRPQKVLKTVEVSSREMVFASERYKASIVTPAISMIALASEKSVTLLGLTNQSEGIVIFSYIPRTLTRVSSVSFNAHIAGYLPPARFIPWR